MFPLSSWHKNLVSWLWIGFFVTLFLPVQIQIGETQSFWNGTFSPFATAWWPGSFFFLAVALVGSGFLFFSGKNSKIQTNVTPVFLWLTLLAWGVLQTFLLPESNTLQQWSFLIWWFIAGLVAWGIAQNHVSCSNLLKVLTIAALMQVALAMWQTIPGFLQSIDYPTGLSVLRSEDGDILRAYGTFAHPNILGFFLVFMFFAVGLREKQWQKWKIVLLLGIVLTFSRSALLALFTGSTLMYFANFDNAKSKVKSQKSKDGESLLGLFIIAIICIFGFFLRSYFDTISPSNVERMSQLQIATKVISENWLAGVGIGNFPLQMVTFDSFFPWQLQPVHNSFLLLFTEMGFIAPLVFSFFFIWSFLQIQKRSENSFSPLLGILGALFIFALFEHLLLTSFVGLILCAVFVGFVSGDSAEEDFRV